MSQNVRILCVTNCKKRNVSGKPVRKLCVTLQLLCEVTHKMRME